MQLAGKWYKFVPCMRISCFFLLLVVAALFGGNALSGCANIVPPSGGPRDSIPPQLVRAVPGDSALNFSGKEITLTFNEFVDIKDPASNVLFTPLFLTNPVISANARTIRIKFNEPLDSNTTYVMNFGNAIVDINEGNPLTNFVYTFSTGPVLDSLEISGRVILAETGGIDSTISVILHRNLTDSAVRFERPQYVVKLDREGRFRFRYLPSDTFAVYALGTVGIGRMYTSDSQLFAFADAPVIAGISDSVVLYAYREKNPPASGSAGGGVLPGRIAASDRRLRFTASQGSQDLRSDFVLNFPVPLREFDSTKITLSVDTAFTTVAFTAIMDSTFRQLRIRSQWQEGKRYNLELQKDFAADTNGRQLLKTDTLYFDTKKQTDYAQLDIRLKNVDLQRNPVLQFIQNNAVVFSAAVKGGRFTESMFTPGEYTLRILYDANDNGKWDPGRYFIERKQPELVVPIQRTITVKPAWENEFDIAL